MDLTVSEHKSSLIRFQTALKHFSVTEECPQLLKYSCFTIRTCIAIARKNAESDMRIHLSSFKPDISEICQNIKQCYFSYLVVLFGKI